MPTSSPGVPQVRLLPALVLIACLGALGMACQTQTAPSPTLTGLHVSGNQIVNGAGQPVRLLGVNRSGTQYACSEGWGIFDGPADQASVEAMKTWKINTVRVPLNESCWLGKPGVPAAYRGANYQKAIANWVNLLTSNGLAVVLDLHWNAPGDQVAHGQQSMPDRDNSPEFWRQVANRFKTNSSVLFDLYNEPHPGVDRPRTEDWLCWRDGGHCADVPFVAAGMQELIDAVRSTGATNIVVVNGNYWSNDLSRFLEFKPNDSAGQMVAGWHVYNWNPCVTIACFKQQVDPVIARMPVYMGEIGQAGCSRNFIEPILDWLDSQSQHYTAWAWVVSDCSAEPSLISDYNGTPTQMYGQGFRNHLTAASARPQLRGHR